MSPSASRTLENMLSELYLNGVGSYSEWLITDQLAYNLASAAIALGHNGAIDALFAAYTSCKTALEGAEGT